MKLKKLAMAAVVLFFSITLLPVNVEAAKKLSVSRVYHTSTKVTGTTKKGYKVKIKIGKKTYQATADKKGKYSVKIPKQKAGKKLTVKAYRKVKKKWKLYTKKSVTVKKLAVNKVYDTSTKVTGTTKKGYRAKIKIGKKTYQATANKKGAFSVKIPKQKAGKKLTVKVYRKVKKKWKLYTQAAVTVQKKSSGGSSTDGNGGGNNSSGTTASLKNGQYKVTFSLYPYVSDDTICDATVSPATKVVTYGKKYGTLPTPKYEGYTFLGWYTFAEGGNKVTSDTIVTRKENHNLYARFKLTDPPAKDAAINQAQLAQDIATAKNTGKTIDKSDDSKTGDNLYSYYIRPNDGFMYVGYTYHYLKTGADGTSATFWAKNGITLYGCVGRDNIDSISTPSPDNYDFKLESGQSKVYVGKDFPKDDSTNLFYKIYGYKDGKLVMINCSNLYLFN